MSFRCSECGTNLTGADGANICNVCWSKKHYYNNNSNNKNNNDLKCCIDEFFKFIENWEGYAEYLTDDKEYMNYKKQIFDLIQQN